MFLHGVQRRWRERRVFSPLLYDPKRVAEVLVHELCPAVDNCKHGHGLEFRAIRSHAVEG